MTLPLANAAEGAGLSKVWARRKIADAEIARTLRQASPEDADKTILALALEHQLVTRLTSLVAVDKTPSRPDGEPLKVTDLPLNLPAGWDFEKVFGPRSREQTPADPVNAPVERRADAADAKTQLAKADLARTQGLTLKRPVIVPAAQAQGVTLPKTATDAELKMIAGAVLMAAGDAAAGAAAPARCRRREAMMPITVIARDPPVRRAQRSEWRRGVGGEELSRDAAEACCSAPLRARLDCLASLATAR